MRRLILLLLFPSIVLASDEGLHSISVSYGQFPESIRIRNTDHELSPESYAAAYSYISSTGFIWRTNAWNEEATKLFTQGAKIEKQAWGGAVSVAYPISDFEMELSYSYSKPRLDAVGTSGNSLEECNETMEYGIGISSFFEYWAWSLAASFQMAYQDSKSEDHILVDNTTLVIESSESGWLASSTLSIGYLYQLNDRVGISPFLAVSWSDFLEGNGLTLTTASRSDISLTTEEEVKLDSDGSGVASIGVGLSFDNYYLDVSIAEAIDLPSIGTQMNVGIGVAW